MKRKLISYEVFENIQKESLSAAERELVEAAPILSKALNVETLELLTYGPETALFESVDGTYVHGQYKIKDGMLTVENIEQLAIDTDTEKNRSRSEISLLVDALIENKEVEAKNHFENYMNLPLVRRSLKEGFADMIEKKKKDKDSKKEKKAKFVFGKKKNKKAKKFGKAKDIKMFGKKAGKKLKEWASLANNVNDFASYQEMGPTLKEMIVEHNDQNEAVKVSMPVTFGRNSIKMQTFDWKTIDTNYKILRTTAKLVAEDQNFCKAVADLKRHNAISDNTALEESLENIASHFPGVLLLTQDELAANIKKALETVKASNYDDQTCAFMAEGILRTAHHAYSDKVGKIVALAGAKVTEDSKDQYADFKVMVDEFYPTLDESAMKEMQLYVDLYEALREVYEIAENENDEPIRSETASHLNELIAIVQRQVKPEIEVAEAAADWLNHLAESSLQAWKVTNSVPYTVNGDVPRMAELGRSSPIMPNQFSKNVASDGNVISTSNADKLSTSWSNIANGDTWPNLSNPYIPKPFGDYTAKAFKGVDKDVNGGTDNSLNKFQDKTWPNLKNPYIPEEPKSIYRMKEDDLIVDK